MRIPDPDPDLYNKVLVILINEYINILSSFYRRGEDFMPSSPKKQVKIRKFV